MKKIVLIVVVFTLAQLNAQTGIGTTTPDASAKLDVYSTNKGFLPPRVALTATNVASPITNPANGLMVFNTVTAGASPYEVVPGYYYWDSTGLKWVSLSTTVGNVQNQGVFRSTSNTNGNSVVSTWNSRFNNIAASDLTVTSNTSFALSNGIYKLEWALPYQQASTYNLMVLQEYRSNVWASFLSDNGYAAVGNGGNTDWGGGTFAADIVDCTSGTRTFRLFNLDGSRPLYYGANFIITKLNPAITTSTTADNLGNHIATKNIQLNNSYLSNDGGNEGIRIDNTGNVGLGTTVPTTSLHIENANPIGTGNPASSISPSIYVYNSNTNSTTANSTIGIRTAGTGSGKPYMSWDIAGVSGYSFGINNPTDQMILNTTWNFTTGTAGNNAMIINRSGQSRVVIPSSAGSYAADWPSGWGGGLITFDVSAASIYANGYVTRSDSRLKNSVATITDDLVAKYLKLRPVRYYWNQDTPRDSKLQYGLIAQEVEPLFPEMVNTGTDEMQTKSVNYQALHALSLKVIQNQQAEIETLKSKQADIEARLLLLETKK
jgi:hypothetical protein